jgi:hypothetical protein
MCANNCLGEMIIVCVISHLAVLQQLVHDGAVAPPCGVVQVEGWRHAHTDLGVVSDTTTQAPQHQGNNKCGQSAGVAQRLMAATACWNNKSTDVGGVIPQLCCQST